jgi:hypothetical protein
MDTSNVPQSPDGKNAGTPSDNAYAYARANGETTSQVDPRVATAALCRRIVSILDQLRPLTVPKPEACRLNFGDSDSTPVSTVADVVPIDRYRRILVRPN